jgi:hypothetical protein
MTEKHIPGDNGPENTETGSESPENGVVSETRGDLAGLSDIPAKSASKFEFLTSRELTDERTREISDFFRLIFNNYWPEFVVCPPCDHKRPEGMRISAFDVYGKQNQPIPLSVLDADPHMPDCPCCGGKMKIFHDPRTTHENIKSKLGKDGYVSLLRDSDSNGINGFAFGYGCTLEEEFRHEWRNPYHYMADPPGEYDRSFEHFLSCLDRALPDESFKPDSKVLCWNCIATIPSARHAGVKNTGALLGNFFHNLPPDKAGLYIIGEAESGTAAHSIFKMLKGEEIPDVFEKGKVLMATKNIDAPPDFSAFLKEVIRHQIRQKANKK